MALTRKALKAMGLTDEQVDSIIEMHTDTVGGLQEQIATYKADAEALPGVRTQLETAQADLEAVKKDSWKVKYDALKEEFEGFKSDLTAKETRAAKEKAYRALLQEAGIHEKRLDAVLRVSDLDSITLDEKGGVQDAEKLTASIKTEWADFITTPGQKGAPVPNPPGDPGSGGADLGSLSMKDYIAARSKQ